MAVKVVAGTQAHGTHGVSMVSAFGGNELGSPRLSGLSEGLHDHFQAGFHRGGAVIGEKDTIQARHSMGLGESEQLLSQAGSRFMGQAEKGGVGNVSQLGSDGFVQFCMPVAVEIGPDGGVSIQVAFPPRVDQPTTFPRDDADGLEGGIHPDRVWGEGMPEMLPVKPDGLLRAHASRS